MQLPSNLLHNAFSEIDVNEKDGKLEILFSTMVGLSGEMSEGWETGIAVDASVSMSDLFGKGLEGSVPEEEKKTYKKKGWIKTRQHDGHEVHYWKDDAFTDAIKKGYLTQTKNIVEPEVRKFSSFLAENLDEDGGTDIIYWACGEDGKKIEEFGELDSQACKKMLFSGPANNPFGMETHLLPAVEYFEKKYRNAKRGLFIFITDGHLNDLEAMKLFTIQLAKKIASGQRNLFKAVLIGIGEEIDEGQMVQLDDIETGTDVDIWDHKIVKEMKDIMEIFAELVDENLIIGPKGAVYDGNGDVVVRYNDGVPARGLFDLPLDSQFFTFEVGDQTIKQNIV